MYIYFVGPPKKYLVFKLLRRNVYLNNMSWYWWYYLHRSRDSVFPFWVFIRWWKTVKRYRKNGTMRKVWIKSWSNWKRYFSICGGFFLGLLKEWQKKRRKSGRTYFSHNPFYILFKCDSSLFLLNQGNTNVSHKEAKKHATYICFL